MSLIVVLTAIRRVCSPSARRADPALDDRCELAGRSWCAWGGGASWAPDALGNPVQVSPAACLDRRALAVNHLGPTTGVDLDPAATAIVGPVARAGSGRRRTDGRGRRRLLIPTIVLLTAWTSRSPGACPRGFPADPAASLRPLQPRQQLRRAPRSRPIRGHHGTWFHTGTTDRRGYLAARDLPP